MVHGVARSQTQLSDFTFTFHFHALRLKWQPTPVFLSGESQGRGSLVGCRLWGHTELDTTEATAAAAAYMYHIFFIYSSVSGHLSCFHVLAIVNSAAINIELHVSFGIISI